MLWDDLRVFLAVHQLGSHKRAGRHLGVAPTTIGRRLAALESALGARLFLRTPERVLATPAGLKLVPHAQRMEAEAVEAERTLLAADSRLEGSLRVTATDGFLHYVLLPALDELRREHPGLCVDLRADTRLLDLSRREADVAVRLVRPKEPALVARRLGEMRFSLFASQPYLDRRGTPRTLDGARGSRLHRLRRLAGRVAPDQVAASGDARPALRRARHHHDRAGDRLRGRARHRPAADVRGSPRAAAATAAAAPARPRARDVGGQPRRCPRERAGRRVPRLAGPRRRPLGSHVARVARGSTAPAASAASAAKVCVEVVVGGVGDADDGVDGRRVAAGRGRLAARGVHALHDGDVAELARAARRELLEQEPRDGVGQR